MHSIQKYTKEFTFIAPAPSYQTRDTGTIATSRDFTFVSQNLLWLVPLTPLVVQDFTGGHFTFVGFPSRHPLLPNKDKGSNSNTSCDKALEYNLGTTSAWWAAEVGRGGSPT